MNRHFSTPSTARSASSARQGYDAPRLADQAMCRKVRRPALKTATALGGRVSLGAAISVALSGLFLADPAGANPQNAAVVSGAATVTQNGNVLTIDQTSQNVQINWDSFSIGAGETTVFNQPGASSIALNRVTGSDPSAIFGGLQSNGQVFLINPNGILFGQSARIDVSALVATTSDISVDNFNAGNYQFDIPSTALDASVVNEGNITVAESGFAALVAPHVRNSGIIAARLGRIELASAQGFTLDLHGDNLLRFDLGTDPSAVSEDFAALVENTGRLSADGGVIAIRAKTIGDVVKNVINLEGFVQANTISQKDGKVILSLSGPGSATVNAEISANGSESGDQGGSVHLEADILDVTGTISATGNDADGGQVDITGDAVRLLDATVDVSGLQAGRIRLGGEFQGGKNLETDELRNADKVLVNDGSVLRANGIGDTGKAGEVIVWADELTQFAGLVDAMPGIATADGAFIEISSGQDLLYRGDIQSRNATILFDPKNITIANGGTDIVTSNDEFAENAAGSVTFDADDITTAMGSGSIILQANNDITIAEDINDGSGNSLSLIAGRSVTINSGVTINFSNGSLNINANSQDPGVVGTERDAGNGNIILTGSTIALGTGSFNAIVENGSTTGGDIQLGDITGGNITATASTNIGGNVTANGILTAATSLSLTADEALTMTGAISSSGANVLLVGRNNIFLDGNIDASTLSVFATQSGGTSVSAADGSIKSTNQSGVAVNVTGNATFAGFNVWDDTAAVDTFFVGSLNVGGTMTAFAHQDMGFFSGSNIFTGGVTLTAGNNAFIRSATNLNIIGAAAGGDVSIRMRNGTLTQSGIITTGDDLRLRMEQDVSPGSVFNISLTNSSNAIGDAVRFETREKDGTEGTFGTVDIVNSGALDVEFMHLSSSSALISGTNEFTGIVNITSAGDMFVKGNVASGTTVEAVFGSNVNLLTTGGNIFSCISCNPGDLGDTNVTISGTLQLHAPTPDSFVVLDKANLTLGGLDVVTDKLRLNPLNGTSTIAGLSGADAWSSAVVQNTSFSSPDANDTNFLINAFTADGTFVDLSPTTNVDVPIIQDPVDNSTDPEPVDPIQKPPGKDPDGSTGGGSVQKAEKTISGNTVLENGDLAGSPQGAALGDAAEVFSSETLTNQQLTDNAEQTGDAEVGETTSDVLGFLDDLGGDTPSDGPDGSGGGNPVPGDAFGGQSTEIVPGLVNFDPTEVASAGISDASPGAAPKADGNPGAGSSDRTGSASPTTPGPAADGDGSSNDAASNRDAAPDGSDNSDNGPGNNQRSGGNGGSGSAREGDGPNGGNSRPGYGGYDGVSANGRMPVPFVSVGLY